MKNEKERFSFGTEVTLIDECLLRSDARKSDDRSSTTEDASDSKRTNWGGRIIIIALTLIATAVPLSFLLAKGDNKTSPESSLQRDDSRNSLGPTVAPMSTSFPETQPMPQSESSIIEATEVSHDYRTTLTDNLSTESIDGTMTESTLRGYPNDSRSHVSKPPSLDPTVAPSAAPSLNPSVHVTRSPSMSPSVVPSVISSTSPSILPASTVTSFFAIGDVPYSSEQALDLLSYMEALPTITDFLIHVGDIRSARDGFSCSRLEYKNVAAILSRSPVPVFIIPGDNEWQDCPNMDEATQYWYDSFSSFESRYWDSGHFDVTRMEEYPESFSFAVRGTLFIGLNIVGGQVHNSSEWQHRLSTQAEWCVSLIRGHPIDQPAVLFGHANPGPQHAAFFDRMSSFIEIELKNKKPLLYINGDQHQWMYDESFYQPSWSRITLTGGSSEPPLYVSVDSSTIVDDESPFSFIRDVM